MGAEVRRCRLAYDLAGIIDGDRRTVTSAERPQVIKNAPAKDKSVSLNIVGRARDACHLALVVEGRRRAERTSQGSKDIKGFAAAVEEGGLAGGGLSIPNHLTGPVERHRAAHGAPQGIQVHGASTGDQKNV